MMSYRSTEIYSHIKEKFTLNAEHVLPQIVKLKRHFMNTTYNDNKTVVDRQAEKVYFRYRHLNFDYMYRINKDE